MWSPRQNPKYGYFWASYAPQSSACRGWFNLSTVWRSHYNLPIQAHLRLLAVRQGERGNKRTPNQLGKQSMYMHPRGSKSPEQENAGSQGDRFTVNAVPPSLLPKHKMFVSLVLRVILSLFVASLLWRFIRPYIIPHPFNEVRGPPSLSFFSGNLSQIFSSDSLDFQRHLAKTYGEVVRMSGLFNRPCLYVYDTKALHHILVKDHHIYEETEGFISGNKMAFGDGLLSTLGSHHRRQRKILNPVFSIAHLRNMTPTFFAVTYKVRDALLRQTAGGTQEVNIVRWMSRAAMEIIGRSGLGMSFDPLTDEYTEHEFIKSVKLLAPLNRAVQVPKNFIAPLIHKYNLGPPWLLRLLVNITPHKTLHKLRDIIDIMHSTSLKIFTSRKEEILKAKDASAEQKDLLSILIQENARADEEDRLPDDEVLAQISTFMFTAMDTTSNALARILWVLAKHPHVQDKLRTEIRESRQNYDEPNYDQLTDLPYLDAICREVLRLYPPLSTVTRHSVQEAVLPLAKPIKLADGSETHEIIVPEDTFIFVAIQSSNTNPSLWGPDADEFKPERWLSPLPTELVGAHIPAVYSHMMTFLGGARACIGFKFSQMEMKVILYTLIDLFRFDLPKQEIFWMMNGLTTPAIDRTKMMPEMPMIISRAQ